MSARKPKYDPVLLPVATYLQRSLQQKSHEGIENDTRVTYFRGKHAVDALLQPAYASLKKTQKVVNRQEAQQLCQKLLSAGYIHRSLRRSAKHLEPVATDQHEFTEDAYYVWDYEGSQFKTLMLGCLLLVGAFACVMFPIWPRSLRISVWYVSMAGSGLLGLLVIVTLLRWFVFVITRFVLPPGIWIIPNLFEDVSFVESFQPFWDWSRSSESVSLAERKTQ
jgi:translocation protein SEC62